MLKQASETIFVAPRTFKPKDRALKRRLHSVLGRAAGLLFWRLRLTNLSDPQHNPMNLKTGEEETLLQIAEKL
jgi:hypothetical protein